MSKRPIILSIAGIDSGGGAGVTADVKTASGLGAYALNAVTCVTAQNTKRLKTIFPIPATVLKDQLLTLAEDFEIDYVKIGMIYSLENVEVIAEWLNLFKCRNVVLDPVLRSTSGVDLVEETAKEKIFDVLLKFSDLVTPNLPEFHYMLSHHNKGYILEKLKSSTTKKLFFEILEEASRFFFSINTPPIFLKGGHLPTMIRESHVVNETQHFDLLLKEGKVEVFESDFIFTKNSHGTGCATSTAISVCLGRDESLSDAIKFAQNYVRNSIKLARGSMVGNGNSAIEHFNPSYLRKFY